MWARRYIYYHGDLYIVIGTGVYKGELCFTAIEIRQANRMYDDNVMSLRIPVNMSIEITNENMLEMLRILYE